jgi:mannose-6-phosphate isomerase-like protein (cupin superfamily)
MTDITRRSLLCAFGIAAVAPLLAAQTTGGGKVVVANPGESRFPYTTSERKWLMPCQLTAEDSGGTLSAFELHALPQSGPARHVHHREDEWYYVLAGDFIFHGGDDQHQLGSGASIWLPRGIPHVWANTSNSEGKLILVCQPGGFEKFFDEMGSAMAKLPLDSPSNDEVMKQVMAKYGMEWLGPPLLKPLRAPMH